MNPASSAVYDFTPEQIELLAQLGHRRWMIERLMHRWTPGEPGAQRDDARHLNPLLVAWDRLDETTRDWNRDTVRELPSLLEKVNQRIVASPVRKVGDADGNSQRTMLRVSTTIAAA